MNPSQSITLCSLLGLFTLLPATAQAGLFDDAMSGEEDSTVEGEEDASSVTMDAGGLSATAGGFNFELNGSVRGDIFVGKQVDENDGEVKAATAETALKLRIKKQAYGDAFAELRFRAGTEDGEPVTEFSLREGYINLYAGPFDFRLGEQIIAWGRADGTNPTDNLTPQDLSVRSADEDDRRIGNVGLRSYLNLFPVRLEFVWLPIYKSGILPPLQLPQAVELGERHSPDMSIGNGTLAGRFNLETTVLDASLSYLYGYATLPGIEALSLVADPDEGMTINARLRAYKQQVIGADFAAAISDWFGLRGEAAFKRAFGNPNNHEYLPEPELSYVLGVDKEFVAKGDLTVSWIVQYIGKSVFALDRISSATRPALNLENLPQAITLEGDDLPSYVRNQFLERNRMLRAQTEAVQHSAMTRLAFNMLHETLHLELLGTMNITTLEWMLRPKLSYDIADAFVITFGGQVFQGPEDTLYGMVDEIQSAAYTELKLSF